MARKYLSYSQVNLYQTCPELYRLKYIDPPPGVEKKPVAFQYGSDVHEMLASIWARKKKHIPDFSYMYNPQEAEDTALSLVEAGKEALFNNKADCGWGIPIVLDPDAVKDNIGLGVELEIKTDGFRGIIDLLGWSTDGRLWVIDWKTTSKSYTPHEIISSDQLTCYAWLTKKQFGRIPDFVAYVTLNKKTKKAKVWADSRSPQQLMDWQRKVESVRDGITRKHFWKNPCGCVNEWGQCDFYHLCWPVEQTKRIGQELPRFGGGTVSNGL